MMRLALLILTLVLLLQPVPSLAAGQWIHYQGNIPDGAVKGGFVPSGDLYVCRTHYRDGTHVGKLYQGKCLIGWDGNEVARQDFEVLVDRAGARWRPTNGGVPDRAVLGGHAPAGDLYICRAHYRDGTHPGKLLDRKCLIGWGGREVAVSPYEVLTLQGGQWKNNSGGGIPSGAVSGGSVSGGEMYVCRGDYQDGLHPGKLWHGRCLIGWGGKEVALDNYQVLVRPGGAMRWARGSRGRHSGFCVTGGQAGGRTQCVCRAHYHDGMHVGKTHQGKCLIGWGGKEVVLDRYEVLVQR